MNTAKIIAALLLVIGLAGGGFYAGHHSAALNYEAQIAKIHADDANALAKAEADARAREQLAADTLAGIQKQNDQDKADAQAQYEKELAALRAGTLRLRKPWQCPADSGLPKASPGSAQPNADAVTKEQLAAEIVRLGAEYDAWIKALQDIVKSDRSNQ